MEEEKKQREGELGSLEEQLRHCTAKSQMTDSELQYPFTCLVAMKSPIFSGPSAAFTVSQP